MSLADFANEWSEVKKKLGTVPMNNSAVLSERVLADWYDSVQNSQTLTREDLSLLLSTEGWEWELRPASGLNVGTYFYKNYHEWLAFYNEHGRTAVSSDGVIGRKICSWQSYMRKLQRGSLNVQQAEILNNTVGWRWARTNTDEFTAQLRIWSAVFAKLGREPSKHSTNAEERKIGQWQHYMRKARDLLTHEEDEILNNTRGWCWKLDDFDRFFSQWSAFYQLRGTSPSETSADKQERLLARWLKSVRFARSGKGPMKISYDQIDMLTNTLGWEWRKLKTHKS